MDFIWLLIGSLIGVGIIFSVSYLLNRSSVWNKVVNDSEEKKQSL